ncbi:YcxB family protein [Elizabethkingia miricola]|uniref:YcxB family protein n=2 Tax=Elizabethkingia miricola TaxID=172045 RepID=UPI000B35B96B|nr:YcxB family protein [Elizabethkingia miricola]NHQ71104.1 YcxB family protein [Elizabethkingia miricola]NHQ79389.1 YcxB family protein [Elizabethkingia miricola]PSL89896.1 hypothetical protein C7V10_02805 [Elizabethkingia miricola]QHQ88497.1 YcxB family protein [Elizabethkingia miricola]UIO96045.1 YcxB family protein [Elizabethkingia miricola]
MELNYKLEEQDYLQLYMYAASKNQVIKQQRQRVLWLLIIIYIICSLLMFSMSIVSLFVFIGAAITVTLIYIYYYERKRYEKFYLKNIRTNLKNRIGINYKTVFGSQDVILTEPNTEAKFKYPNIELVEEINTYYFFKMKTGERFIIPKSAIQNPQEFNQVISRLSKDYNIQLQQELNWKWR